MFSLTRQSASNVIQYFPKMTSANYLIPLPWPLPRPWPWPQPPLPTPLPSPMLLPMLPAEPLPPIVIAPKKCHIESYDEWFDRRLNDKTDDMFLL